MGVRQSQIRKKKKESLKFRIYVKSEGISYLSKKKSFGKTSTVDLWRERRDKLLLRDFIFLSSLNSGGSRIFFYGGSTVVELGICHEGQVKK